jgi:perosamine synthetase
VSRQKVSKILPKKEPELIGKNQIPVAEPDISKKEQNYVNQAVKSGWVSSEGKFVSRFEKLFAKRIGPKFKAFSVNSGTSALHVAISSLGIGKGDEVILPTFTMVATANAVTYTGAKPVLVDADPITWNMNPDKIREKITKKTKAIVVVHIYGLTCDMDPILKLAKKYNLWVIEDAAEALGAVYKGKMAGGIGDVSAFSFYANKVVTTGEGGMVVTKNKQIAQRIEALRNNAFNKQRHFWHEYVGFGYRMTNLQAALGLAQMERFDSLLNKRRVNAKKYLKKLGKLDGLTFPIEPEGYKNSYWMFGVLVDEKIFGMSKDSLRKYLAYLGIETRSFFIPIHLQPAYNQNYLKESFPVSQQLCSSGFYLPSSSTLTSRQIDRVCKGIISANN